VNKVLAWIKGNLAVVIAGVLIVGAPVACFFISSSMNAGVKEELSSSVNEAWGPLTKYATTRYTIPALLPGGQEESINGVLNEASIAAYGEAMKTLKAGADDLYDQIVARNGENRSLLVPGLLPAPPTGQAASLPFEMPQSYPEAHARLLQQINAGSPPMQDILMDALLEAENAYLVSLGRAEDDTALTEDEEAELTERLRAARMKLYQEYALRYSVFADPLIFELETWALPEAPPLEQCYLWQEAYWARQDVLNAIRLANTNSEGDLQPLLDGPVKRIEKLIVRDPSGERAMTMTGGREGGLNPGRNPQPINRERGELAVAVTPNDPTKAIDFQAGWSKSLTGRQSPNGLFDIRVVDLKVHVASDRVNELIAAITATNLMAVTELQIVEIPGAELLRQGYLYGNQHVVEAALAVEVLFFRDWTARYMPASIKKARGVPTETEEDMG
jgi:hypothetical protein